MSWLIIHMWVELLVAAAFGGLIGWALHAYRRGQVGAVEGVSAFSDGGDGDARIAELETQLRMEQEEIATLRAKADAVGSVDEEGSPAWRNRYLESRVRFLEGKLADVEASVAPARPPEDENDEPTRLRWRNRYLEGRVKYLEEELVNSAHFAANIAVSVASVPAQAVVVEKPVADDRNKPAMLDAPREGAPDDLKEITGIGPKLEKTLNELGIYHFDQIASWTQNQIDWVNSAISFRGRIEREHWVLQASQLVQGIETEGKRKYMEGRQS